MEEQWRRVQVAARAAVARLVASQGDWDDVLEVIDELNHIEQLAIEAIEDAPGVCQHDWHLYGTINGREDWACQTCGATR